MSFYGILNSIWRRERQTSQLINLKNDFFEKARAYLKHLENQAITEQDELIKELFKKRWERATYLVNDLINLRIEKHIRQTLSGEFQEVDEKKMPYEEKEFRSRLETLTTKFRETVHGIGEDETAEETQSYFEDEEYQLVKMIKAENISTVGEDLLNYGPFKVDDLVYLPTANARIMLKKSQAQQIQIE